jgi:putative transposase
MQSPTGYYRRRLPHYQPERAAFFITSRLAGSLPSDVILSLMRERDAQQLAIRKEEDEVRRRRLEEEQHARYFGKFDEYLDSAMTGPDWLRRGDVAGIVSEAIHRRDGKKYDLLSFCVMPNHIHLVVDVERSDASLYRILQSLKAFTAVKANRILGRCGAFWQHESYDHVVRDDAELDRILWYIVENPVKAQLCRRWQDWRWTYVKKGLIEE